jgi:hypothetical protein
MSMNPNVWCFEQGIAVIDVHPDGESFMVLGFWAFPDMRAYKSLDQAKAALYHGGIENDQYCISGKARELASRQFLGAGA